MNSTGSGRRRVPTILLSGLLASGFMTAYFDTEAAVNQAESRQPSNSNGKEDDNAQEDSSITKALTGLPGPGPGGGLPGPGGEIGNRVRRLSGPALTQSLALFSISATLLALSYFLLYQGRGLLRWQMSALPTEEKPVNADAGIGLAWIGTTLLCLLWALFGALLRLPSFDWVTGVRSSILSACLFASPGLLISSMLVAAVACYKFFATYSLGASLPEETPISATARQFSLSSALFTALNVLASLATLIMYIETR